METNVPLAIILYIHTISVGEKVASMHAHSCKVLCLVSLYIIYACPIYELYLGLETDISS